MTGKKFSPRIFLFLIAFCAAVIPLAAPIEHHWTLQDLLISVNTPFPDLFKPFLGTSTRMYLFRPFSLLLIKILYFLFHFNIPAYRLYKALCLSLFSLSVYAYLNRLTPARERQNFWLTALCTLSPPVFVSTYMITAEDIPGSALLFASLALFLRLAKEGAQKNKKVILAFYACVLLTCLIRETSRTHLFLLLALHFFHERKSLSPAVHRSAFYAMGLCATATLFSMALMSRVAFTPWLKLPLTGEHAVFLLQNAFSQIIACVSFSAMTLIVYAALLRRAYAKMPKPSRVFLFVVFAFLFLTIKKQPLLSFSYFGLYVFSPSYIMPVVSFLFFLVLLSKMRSPQEKDAFCSQAVLLIVFITLGATLFLKSVREDLPSRTFISILPFLFYFVFQAFLSLHALWEEQKLKGFRTHLLRLSFAYFLVNAFLYFVFSPVNYAFEFQQRAFSSDESKRALANENLRDTLVFYTNDVYPAYPEDFSYLTPGLNNKTLNPRHFFVLEPFKQGNTPEEKHKKIKEEICLKAAGLYVHVDFKGKRGEEKLVVTWPEKFNGFKEKAAIYIQGEKMLLNASDATLSMEGRFETFTRGSLSEFTPSKKFSSRGYWENGMPVVMQAFRYSHESDIETMLNAMRLMPLYENALPYPQFPQSLEEFWVWGKITHAFTLKNVSRSRIYSLNISRLNCHRVLGIKPGTQKIPRDFYAQ